MKKLQIIGVFDLTQNVWKASKSLGQKSLMFMYELPQCVVQISLYLTMTVIRSVALAALEVKTFG